VLKVQILDTKHVSNVGWMYMHSIIRVILHLRYEL
jgi:hypothetical protein